MRSFIDESGTPSRAYPLPDLYFVVVCVTVPDEMILADMLADYRRAKGWSARREIKFTELSDQQRREILFEFRQYQASIAAAIIDKRQIKTPIQALKASALYKRSVALAISHSVRDMPCDHVLIDQYFNSKVENRQFISYLRQTINADVKSPREKHVGDFGVGDSAISPGLQVADILAGAVAHYYRDNNNIYRRILHSILDECFWPENE